MHHPKDVDRPGFRIRLVKQDIISNQFFPDPCLRNITILHQAAALREQLEKMRSKEARREERAQQAAQQTAGRSEDAEQKG